MLCVFRTLSFVLCLSLAVHVVAEPDPASGCPELVTDWTKGPADAVFLDHRFAYFGSGTTLMIGDISNLSSPEIVGHVELERLIGDFFVEGDFVYVAAGNLTQEPGALILVDISDPNVPSVVWSFATPRAARCVVVDGRYAYLGLVNPADPTGGMLQIVDLSPLAGPRETALHPFPGWPDEITVEESIAWVTDLGLGARAINIANPALPTEIAFLEGDVRDHHMKDGLLYLLEWRDDASDVLRILDVTDPVNYIELGEYDTNHPRYLDLSSSTAYIVSGSSASIKLEIVDTSPPEHPTRLGVLTLAPSQGEIFAHDVASASRRVLMTHSLGGPSVVDALSQSQPAVVGTFESYGSTTAVSAHGGLVGLASGESGLALFDFADLWAGDPEPRSWWRGGTARDVVLSMDHAFIAAWFDGIRIVDISNPEIPAETAAIETGFPFFRLVLDGGFLYASYYGSPNVETAIIDVSDPQNPTQVSQLQGGVLAVEQGFAYADWSDWLGQCALATWDVSDPTNPSDQPTHIKFWGACARCDWPWPSYGRSYELDPHRAIAGFASWENQGWVALGQGGLVLLDLSVPSAPVQIASYDVNACGVSSVAATRGTAYVATNTYSGMLVVQGSEPGGISETGVLPLPGFPTDVVISNGLVITANATAGMSIMDIKGCYRPLRATGRRH